MTEQITITLPSAILETAEILARRAGRPVNELLAEAIELSLRPLGNAARDEPPPDRWSDEETLKNSDLKMPEAEDERLSGLLEQQQAGSLTTRERSELSALMAQYQRLLLRKAQGLREAVRRGLRPPVQP
jgi:hypothetical protein